MSKPFVMIASLISLTATFTPVYTYVYNDQSRIYGLFDERSGQRAIEYAIPDAEFLNFGRCDKSELIWRPIDRTPFCLEDISKHDHDLDLHTSSFKERRLQSIAWRSSSEWRSFKRRFEKSYRNQFEEDKRVLNYLYNKEMINRHNAKRTSFEMKLNRFADWYPSNLQRLKGLEHFDRINPVKAAHRAQVVDYLAQFLNVTSNPKDWDWRWSKNRVSPVRYQGDCASCWAFTAAGVLEGQQYRLGAKNLSALSVQQMLDCVTESEGCDGGHYIMALRYVEKAGGIEGWYTYPYNPEKLFCFAIHSQFIMRGAPIIVHEPNKEDDMLRLVANYGPIAVSFKAPRSLYFYTNGVYTDCTSNGGADHSGLIVGYGTDPEHGDYWLVKNSWGTDWGIEGYVKIKRGVNMCGIALEPGLVMI